MKRTYWLITALLLGIAGIAYAASGTIKGTVTDVKGSPVSRAECRVGSVETISDAKGTFTLTVQPGKHRVICQRMGYQKSQTTVAVPDGGSVKVAITLRIARPMAKDMTDSISPPTRGAGIPPFEPRPMAKITRRRGRRSPKRKRIGRRVRYPMTMMPSAEPAAPVHNTEQYDSIAENGFKSAARAPLSTFSIDVDTASYSNARRHIDQSQRPPRDAVKVEEFINYFSYTYPDPKGPHPFSVTTEVSSAPWNPKHRLVHIGLQGKRIDTRKMAPQNLVFLLDVSGSMRNPNKLPLLKQAFRLLVDNLRPQDQVAIVVYASASGLVLPSTMGKHKDKILSALQNLRAGGSTAGGAGIQLAYQVAQDHFIKGGNNRVILATDGDFNVGTSSDSALVQLIEKKRESGVFLTVLGFGTGNYKDAKMEKLADKGNGNHAYIDSILEAKKVLVTEMGATLTTIAKDVKIQVEFNPAKVKGYRLIGYENRRLKNQDFNDDKKDAGELGAGHSVTVLYEIIPAGSKEEVPGIDELKYQKTAITEAAQKAPEMMTVKLRYKKPDGKKSILLDTTVIDSDTPFAQTSDNFRFSSAVAEFAMLLRDSKHKGKSSFAAVVKRAKKAAGKDPFGYRFEFIRLVQKAELLK